MDTNTRTNQNGTVMPWWTVALIAGAAILAVSNDSLWIDECVLAAFGSSPSLGYAWEWMQQVRFHEIQSPFYIAYMWGWLHAFGQGEWTMRIAAAPWFIGGALLFVVGVGRLVGSTPLVALAVAFNAMAWYYLNEARVYGFQLGFALGTVGMACEVVRTTLLDGAPRRWAVRLFLLAFVGLCGSSVLGAVWGVVILLGMLSVLPPARWLTVLRTTPFAAVLAGILLLGLLGYYDWTRSLNLKATQVGTTTPATAVFVFYELLGFTGLGPGRTELRESALASLPRFLVPLGIFAAATACVLWLGFREARAGLTWRKALLLFCLVAAPVLGLLAIGVLTRFRVLGRHVMPLLPIVLLMVCLGIAAAWRRGRFARTAGIVFLSFSVLSCLSVRFAMRHGKDDYRSAARLARTALEAGQTVWWNADVRPPFYYKFPVAGLGSERGAHSLQNPLPDQLTNLPAPHLVLRNRPDTYDAYGTVAQYLQARGYAPAQRFTAFTAWVPTNAASAGQLK